MNLDEFSLEEIVIYINSQLELGRSMKEVEIIDFKVNDRVMVKRLNRKGYKRVENNFIQVNIKDGVAVTENRYNTKIKKIMILEL